MYNTLINRHDQKSIKLLLLLIINYLLLLDYYYAMATATATKFKKDACVTRIENILKRKKGG